jgi:mono/diheme cytochrome c family protein
MNITKVMLIICTTVLFIAACNQSGPVANQSNVSRANTSANTGTNAAAASTAQPAATGDELSAGKELYAAKCTICHKDTGKGGKVTVEGKNLKPADLTSDKMKARSDDKLVAGISEGAPDDGMPAFEDKLTKDQIKSIVKYVRTLQQ